MCVVCVISQAFDYISSNAKFSWWEKISVRYSGAVAMRLVCCVLFPLFLCFLFPLVLCSLPSLSVRSSLSFCALFSFNLLPTYLSSYPSIYLSTCYLPTFAIYPSTYPSSSSAPPIGPLVDMYLSLSPRVSLSLSLSLSLSFSLSLCVCVSVCLCVLW